MRKALLLAATLALLAVFVAAPAGATSPVTTWVEEFDWQEVFAECDGFDVLADSTVRLRMWEWTDAEGNAVAVRENWRMREAVHRDDGTGPELSATHHWVSRWIDPTDPDAVIAHGIMYNTVVPGYGAVYRLSGRIFWDQHDWPPTITATGTNRTPYNSMEEATPILCDYFG